MEESVLHRCQIARARAELVNRGEEDAEAIIRSDIPGTFLLVDEGSGSG